MTDRNSPRHLVFATDFTARCDRAQDRAIQLAVQWGAKLTVVHALETAGLSDASWVEQEEVPVLIAREATRLREELSTVEGLQAAVIIRRGSPSGLVLDILGQDPADLIVTGISRNDSLGRAILGSTATSLVKESGVPVLVVKKRPTDWAGRIVLASDLSQNSAHAIRTALACFRPEAPVLFHAVDPPFKSWAEDKETYARQFRAESIEQCRRFLAEALGPDRAAEIAVVTQEGEPAAVLAAYVIDHDIDMVVTGTQGRTGVMNILLGSTAAGILDEVPCDVFIVPPQATKAD